MSVNHTVDEMEADLGEQLKRLRLNKNLDQKTLASQAGISVRALRNLEGGEGTTLHTLLSVVRALGRESWLQTVAPVPTINPATFTIRSATRLRAASPRRQAEIVKPVNQLGALSNPAAIATERPNVSPTAKKKQGK